jgi:hypothetical protein
MQLLGSILLKSFWVLAMKSLTLAVGAWFLLLKEIVSAGGKTVWGNPAEVGKVVEGAAFDVVLDNNGKDLDAVRFVTIFLVASE